MNLDRLIRPVFWLSAGFNFGAAFLFAFPAAPLGQWIGLPPDVPVLYSALAALFVALFGGMYAWLAMQAVLPRPMVALAAIGKASAFLLAATLWFAGEVPGRIVQLSVGDLALAGIYARWLYDPSPNNESI
ncbi:MAG: hypothetical protein AABY95_06210 [Pseudomonadota bacterium]